MNLFLSDPWSFLLLGFAFLAHSATIVLGGPAATGAAAFIMVRMKNGGGDLGLFYRGFSLGAAPYYAGIILACLVILPSGACLAAAALARMLGGEIIGWLLALPFLLLMAVYVVAVKVLHMYLFYALAERPSDIGSAFERTRILVAGNPMEHLVLGLYLAGLNLAGLLACAAGLLFTVPLTLCTVGAAYWMASGREGMRPEEHRRGGEKDWPGDRRSQEGERSP